MMSGNIFLNKNDLIPEAAIHILDKLNNNGYEAYIVGGCVRDIIMGRTPDDWDITTSALPEKVKSLFSRTFDTGLKHGTVTVLEKGTGYEVTTFRVDGTYSDGRHPDSIKFTPSLEEDLKRRDFTINALAWNEKRGLVDLFGGIRDIEAKLIRCVGNPDERFTEDALRIMRAIRFAAKLSFDIEENTKAAIKRHAGNLAKVSIERIRTEFEKTLTSARPEFVNFYKEYGLAEYIIRDERLAEMCFDEDSFPLYHYFHDISPACQKPEIGRATYSAACGGQDNSVYCQKPEIGRATCSAACGGQDASLFCQKPENAKVLLLAAFLKNLSENEASKVMRDLKYDNFTRKAVSDVIKYKNGPDIPQKKFIKELLCKMGKETFYRVYEYKRAEASAEHCLPGKEHLSEEKSLSEEEHLTGKKSLSEEEHLSEEQSQTEEKYLPEKQSAGKAPERAATCADEIEAVISLADEIIKNKEPYCIPMLALNGKDLIDLGMTPGSQIGEMLDFLLKTVIEHPELNNKESLIKAGCLNHYIE